MDNQRKHLLQQQQLLRQRQQAQQFQKQQEQLREQQQQGNLRNPQQLSQDQLGDQQHFQKQKQEYFLRNYKKSSALNGATVVNISPGIHVPMSASPTCVATEWTFNQVGGMVQGVPFGLLTEMPVSNPYLASQAEPTNNAHPPGGTDTPISSTHSSAGVTTCTRASTSETSQATVVPVQSVEPPNNTIALKDGSIIILKAEDEILFRGPNGVEMVVNCLPLYEPPPVEREVTNVGNLRHDSKIFEEHSLNKAMENQTDGSKNRSFSLIKSRSEHALDSVTAELELHDNDCIIHRSEETIMRIPVAITPSKWFNSSTHRSVGVAVHNSFDSALIMAQSDSHSGDLLGGDNNPKGSTSESYVIAESNEVVNPEKGIISFKAVIAKPTPEIVDPKLVVHKKLQASRSESPSALEDSRSDDDSDKHHLQVNYLDTPSMSSLRRASGSVSFFSRISQATSLIKEKHKSNGVISEDTRSAPLEDRPSNPPLTTPNSSEFFLKATPQPPTTILLIPSPLPDPPSTLDPSYIERSGWLNKLSHRRGIFGDKWQKRYFVLHRSWLYYFKKYGDSNPRGVVRLMPTAWCQPVAQGSTRMADAVSKSGNTARIISVLRCLAVHRSSNFSASLCDLLGSEGVAEAFNRQTVSMTNSQHLSRTYYMVAPSDAERDSWVQSITNNIQAYSHSSEALKNACKELKIMLRAVYCTIAPKHIPSLLYLLHTKNKSLFHSTSPPQNDTMI